MTATKKYGICTFIKFLMHVRHRKFTVSLALCKTTISLRVTANLFPFLQAELDANVSRAVE